MKRLRLPVIIFLVTLLVSPRPVAQAQESGEIAPSSTGVTLDIPTTPYNNQAACADPANPIVAENCQEGTDDWVVNNPSTDIAGFASATSVNLGESLDFFVDTTATRFDLLIFRNGYYGGKGARLMQAERDLPGVDQADCYSELYSTGLLSCSNWTKSYTLMIGDDWVSGYYAAKLVNQDTGGENYVQFVVRDDARDSDILFQQSMSTLNAYNNWGGKSTYTTASRDPFRCLTVTNASRAAKVSFLRPMNTGLADNYLYKVGFPMVMWLEGSGYDVTYASSLDTHRWGKPGATNELLDHKVFLMVGHDEYWSQEMRDAIQAARDAGVHIGNFSANTGYWRVRFEDDPATGQAETVMVTYKTTENSPVDPTGHHTGTWRDPNGANAPENELLGVMYIGDNDSLFFPVRVSSEDAKDPFYRNTGLQEMPPGTSINIGHSMVGWEWDAVVDNGKTPENLTILAETPTYGGLLTDAGFYYDLGKAVIHTTRYTADSGAIVFSSGMNLWSWGLELVAPDRRVQQMTYNLLADMGVQPVTPADTLILDGQTPDELPDYSAEYLREGEGSAPVISNLQVDVEAIDVTFSWETDKPATGQVWLRSENTDWRRPRLPLNQLITSQALHTDYTTTHSLIRANLDLGMSYEYYVSSMDSDGRVTVSDKGTFVTSARNLNARLFDVIQPTLRSVQCFVEGNKPAAIGIGGVAVLGVALGLWRGVVFFRRRRKA